MKNRAVGMIDVFSSQACTLMAVMYYGAGREWMDGGTGLHPILAGALVAAFLIAPYLIVSWGSGENDD